MPPIRPRLGSAALALFMAVALLAPTTAAETDGALVYPGMRYGIEGESRVCTLGFLFERVVDEEDEPRPPEYYASTAGHCAFDRGHGELVWTDGDGPRVTATDQDFALFGRFVFAGHTTLDQVPYDLALIRLDGPAALLDPAVCYLGGPTHLDVTPRVGEGETLWHVGQSQRVLQPRPGRAVVMTDPRVLFQGAGLPGDSGGPLLGPDGAALGVLSAIVGDPDHPEATHAASRLSAQLPHAEEVLGFELELMTAPRNDVNWPLDAVASSHCGRGL